LKFSSDGTYCSKALADLSVRSKSDLAWIDSAWQANKGDTMLAADMSEFAEAVPSPAKGDDHNVVLFAGNHLLQTTQ
jgi:hypothetical protein